MTATFSDEARVVAEAFAAFCDGLEQAGFAEYARRGRLVAGLLLEALDGLDAERSCRTALQARCETQQALLGSHADDEIGWRMP